MAVLSEESEAMLQHVKEAKAILLDASSDASSQDEAIKELSQVVYDKDIPHEIASKVKDYAVEGLNAVYKQRGDISAIVSLAHDLRTVIVSLPKAKGAKLLRSCIDTLGDIEGPEALTALESLLPETIAWAREQRRTFLRLRLETKAAAVHVAQGAPGAALTLLSGLLREVKRLEDKPLLVEAHVTESKAHYSLKNVPKARAALTAARTAATAIYVGPRIQAQIDELAGTLHAEDEDYTTAYSYWLEAFEGYRSLSEPVSAARILRWMALAKIMSEAPGDALALLSGKYGVEYHAYGLQALRDVAKAHQNSSVDELEAAQKKWDTELSGDALIARHTATLRQKLVHAQLLRVCKPYSCVELEHVAKLMGMPVPLVEATLAGMILDGELAGTLDQGRGTLELHDSAQYDALYPAAILACQGMHTVLASLHKRADKL